MVSATIRSNLAAAFAMCLVLPLPAKEPADYPVGDIAGEDIITPVALDVIDPDATAARKETEALRTPAIFRNYPETTNEVETRFVAVFADVRAAFLAEIPTAYHPIPLDEQTISSARFGEFVGVFNRKHSVLPVSTNLARLWAGGDDGLVIQTSLVTRLRQAMRRHIRADEVPADLPLGDTLRLVPVRDPDETITPETAEQRGKIVTQTSVATLSRARTLLRREFPNDEQVLARAVAAFLKPDCVVDAVLTQQARNRQVDRLAVADHYNAGQVIVPRGQVINKKVKVALDQLREKAQVGDLQRSVAEQEMQARQVRENNRWLLAGLAGVTAILVLVIWRLGRRPQPVTLLPATLGAAGSATVVSSLTGGTLPGTDAVWQQRVLEAEQRVEKARAALRSGLRPHLARLLASRLVQGLISQRARLLDTQQKAADEIAMLDRRLDELQALLQERLRAYEGRIVELEKELAQKGEENRELLKARILNARKELDAGRAKSGLGFN